MFKCETCRNHRSGKCDTWCDHGEEYIPDMNNIPTAEVEEVKHGEWEVNVGMNYNRERICPICKEKIESNHWDYCPHCGAKMDGGKEE